MGTIWVFKCQNKSSQIFLQGVHKAPPDPTPPTTLLLNNYKNTLSSGHVFETKQGDFRCISWVCFYNQSLVRKTPLNHVYCNGTLYLRLVSHLFIVYRYYDKKNEQHRRSRYASSHTLLCQDRKHKSYKLKYYDYLIIPFCLTNIVDNLENSLQSSNY